MVAMDPLARTLGTDGYPSMLSLKSDPAGSQRPRPCPGMTRVREPAGGRKSTHTQGSIFGSRDRYSRAAGGRRPLRPPDAPLEPQDAPLHIRRARRDPHHRPSEDGAPAEP